MGERWSGSSGLLEVVLCRVTLPSPAAPQAWSKGITSPPRVPGGDLRKNEAVALIRRNVDASKKNFVATQILVFDFELFIGERYDLGANTP